MIVSKEWTEEFQSICESLQQDILMLEALTLRAEQKGADDPIFPETFRRLLDYLEQHTDELCFLGQTLENGADPIKSNRSETQFRVKSSFGSFLSRKERPSGEDTTPPAPPADR